MRELSVDVAVIGGGPAGLAAALEVAHRGRSCAILERNTELGGILQQCIHDGFGLLRFGESVSGCTYAQRFIDRLEAARTDGARIEVLLDTMVLELASNREIWATNPTDGMVHVRAGAVILAMGCRERTAAQVLLHGERPQGVITAGAAQRYINVEGYLPGTHAVILGSGDIGLIMARRMALEGIEVEGVYEIMDHPGGLARNVVQCLEDYGIPLRLSHMVSRVHGKHRLEGVTVAARGADGKPVAGTERYVPCDLLVLDDIAVLWDYDMGGHPLAAVMDLGIMASSKDWRGKQERLGFSEDDSYFNSGVLVVDLKAWRAHDYGGQAERLAAKNAYRHHDQDALNELFHRNWQPVPLRWNVIPPVWYLFLKILRRRDFRRLAIEARQHISILHYAGGYKPWEYDVYTAFNASYYEYLRQTEFRDAAMPQPDPRRKGRSIARQLRRLKLADFWQRFFTIF